METHNSTDAHALAQQMAFKGIPASQYRLVGHKLECRYITSSTDFWATPSIVAYSYISNREAVRLCGLTTGETPC